MNDNLRYLPLVASAVGGKHGVTIKFDQVETAETDGNVITLPAAALTGSDEDAALMVGWVDHESAHIKYTDLAFVDAAGLSPLEQEMWNALEDPRVERLQARMFPGCRENIARTLQVLSDREVLDLAQDPAVLATPELVFDGMFRILRHRLLGQVILAQQSEAFMAEIRQRLGDRVARQLFELAFEGVHAASTAGCVAAARAIVTMLAEEAEKPPQEEPDSSDSTPPQEGSGEASPGANDGGSQGDPGSNPASAGQSPSAGNGSRDQQQAIRQLLDMTVHELASASSAADVGSLMSQSLQPQPGQQAYVGEAGTAAGQDASALDAVFWGPGELEALANRLLGHLDHRLEAMLEDRVQRRREVTRSGRLDSRRLARLPLGNVHVFSREPEEEGLNTAICIVQDMSSSMNSRWGDMTRAQSACATLHAIGNTLHRLDVPFAAVQYNGQVAPPIDFDRWRRQRERLFKSPRGGTRTGLALMAGGSLLAQRDEERKLLILVSDGEDNADEVAVIRAELARMGVETAAVFIGQVSRLLGVFGESGSVATAPAELTQAVFKAVANAF